MRLVGSRFRLRPWLVLRCSGVRLRSLRLGSVLRRAHRRVLRGVDEVGVGPMFPFDWLGHCSRGDLRARVVRRRRILRPVFGRFLEQGHGTVQGALARGVSQRLSRGLSHVGAFVAQRLRQLQLALGLSDFVHADRGQGRGGLLAEHRVVAVLRPQDPAKLGGRNGRARAHRGQGITGYPSQFVATVPRDDLDQCRRGHRRRLAHGDQGAARRQLHIRIFVIH
mmetsp:Transcript_120274/g.345802  ORF Transcript_120274/g.345802 Transcript_120274/m.345802 type:complete len:223 (-) Transcript_120274:710-1378(-)